MFVCETASVNAKNHLQLAGCDCTELAGRFGTPLYVMDEGLIRQNCRKYKDALDRHYKGNGMILYASKAFCAAALCKIAAEEGLGLDVVSGGELYTAQKAGFPMDRIYFHGNNKSVRELEMAVRLGVRRIVVDNELELDRIAEIAGKIGKTLSVSFRLKPGIDAHTHDFVQTGKNDAKFGFTIDTGEAMAIVRKAVALPNISVDGIHCHIGSQIFDLAPFETAARVMLKFIADVKAATGHFIGELNLGGGYGIKYLDEHDPVDYGSYIESVSTVLHDECELYGLDLPSVVMEPGRSIVASAGITLYTAGAIKKIDDDLTYVMVDGGMFDNPRYALYEAPYDAVVANRAGDPETMRVTIAGKCCESGDLIGKNIGLATVRPGDLIAVFATGAYNYSMSSNYNRNPRPPVVLVHGASARVIVKGEDYDDIIRNDVL